MIQLSDRVEAMEESATLAMSKKSRELKAQGKDVISLSLGEPDFFTPQFIKDAAIEGMNQNFTMYTPVPGYEDLRQAIANKFQRDNGIHYDKNQIVVPTTIENDFKFTPKQFEESITGKSKLMIFSSPCNPTGTVYSKEELRGLADVLVKHPDLVVLSDEIYEHINFVGSHASMAQFDDVYNQVVTVNGVSKAWAMTGWRVGYMGAPKVIADACEKVQGQFTSATCSIAQRATIAAVNADPAVLKDMIAAFAQRRELVLNALAQMPGVKSNKPGGAFYVFPDISSFFGKKYDDKTIENASDLCMYLLNVGLVALVTGDAFGDPNCLRISYAASEETLTEAMRRMAEALKNLA